MASPQEIGRLRVTVGYLGEKSQHGWWSSEFFSANAEAFLAPVFGKTVTLTQYHGASEAARRIHDEYIGIGRVFHLFRLPESVEQAVFEALQAPDFCHTLRTDIESRENAQAVIQALASPSTGGTAGAAQQGPIQVGTIDDIESSNWLSEVAHCYQAAFTAGVRAYPYLVDGK